MSTCVYADILQRHIHRLDEIPLHILKSFSQPRHPKCAVSSFPNPFLSLAITKQRETTLIQRHEWHMSQVIA